MDRKSYSGTCRHTCQTGWTIQVGLRRRGVRVTTRGARVPDKVLETLPIVSDMPALQRVDRLSNSKSFDGGLSLAVISAAPESPGEPLTWSSPLYNRGESGGLGGNRLDGTASQGTGRNPVDEYCHLAKVGGAGSNPVFRSKVAGRGRFLGRWPMTSKLDGLLRLHRQRQFIAGESVVVDLYAIRSE